jgi:hypothetical protein
MQLKVGAYSFLANSLWVTSQEEVLKTQEANLPYGWRVRLMVTGFLTGTSQSDLTTKQNALQLALRIPNQNIIFYQDSGAISATKLLVANSITGVIIEKVSFPGMRANEYVNERQFTFEAYAEYPLNPRLNYMMSYSESVMTSGGGPIYIHKNALNGIPQKQQLYPATAYVATQHGSAVGYRSYPPFPGPIWPGAQKHAPVITRTAPRRNGYGLEQYTVEWQYTFESASVLVGLPNIWFGGV